MSNFSYSHVNDARILRETCGYTIELPDSAHSQFVHSNDFLDSKFRDRVDACNGNEFFVLRTGESRHGSKNK